MSELKPDLIVAALDMTAANSDPLDLSLSGEVAVQIANDGTAAATGPVTALAFYDADGDGVFSAENDLRLGSGTLPSDLAVGSEASLAIPVEGTLPFRDAPIRVWVDSSETSVELSEGNNYAGDAGQCAGPEESVALDLAMCMDASGSVSWGEFQLQLDGTAAAIEDPEIVPHDGSVRLSALQFSSWTRVELPPTIITEENAAQVAEQIRSIRKLGGGTSIHSCISSAVSQITSASPSSAIKVIDVSTDGRSSRTYAIRASERAREAGIDTLNAIGVGSGVDRYLLEQIVFPQPVGGERGFVLTIDNYDDYGAGIAGKVQREVRVVDLTVGALTVTDGGVGQPATMSLLVGNAGTGDVPIGTVLRLQGLGADGALLWQENKTLEAVTASGHVEVSLSADLPPGVAEVVATVDPAQTVGGCNRENNRVSRPVGTELGAIDVATDASQYGASVDVLLTGDFENQGALLGEFQPVLLVEDTAGNPLASFDNFDAVILAPGEQLSVTATWDTGTYLAGPYRLRGLLVGADGEPVAEDAAPFEIVHDTGGEPAAGLRLTTDRATYHTSDRVVLENLARNLTANRILETPTVTLTVTGPNGAEWLQSELSLSSLQPGGEGLAFDELLLDAAPEGQYQARATLRDGIGPVLASSVTAFTVSESLDLALSGRVAVAHDELYQGDPQSCTFEMSNDGAGMAAEVPTRYMSTGIDDGSAVIHAERSLTIDAGELDAYHSSFDTDALSVGMHACVLRAQIDGEWRTLDYAPFRLLEPPIRIDASVGEGPRGRVLVLLDGDGTPGTANGRDPHGPNGAAGVPVQQERLEGLLEQWGWSYTLVTDADAFTRELRSDGYTTYLLLNEQVRLDNVAQRELREAVYRGAGLIVAGDHDQRNLLLDEPLGIAARGSVNASMVTFTDITEPGQSVLAASSRSIRVQTEGAEVVARFGSGAPAVTDHRYGEGQALYTAFDWLAETATTGDSVIERFMQDALAHVHPETYDVRPGGVLPIRVQLINEGIATGGRVSVALPPGVTVVEAGGGTVSEAGLQWPFSLEEEQQLVFDAWVRIDAAADDTVELITSIETGEPEAYEPYGEPIHTVVPVTPVVSINELQAAFTEHAPERKDPAFEQAERWMAKAADAKSNGDRSAAIRYLVEASDRLTDEAYAPLRLVNAGTLRTLGYRWWSSSRGD
ncbi:MAG: DUF1194 domain-containing protein [Pseudomonadota bacterium]